jgi:hypothetical protein
LEELRCAWEIELGSECLERGKRLFYGYLAWLEGKSLMVLKEEVIRNVVQLCIDLKRSFRESY